MVIDCLQAAVLDGEDVEVAKGLQVIPAVRGGDGKARVERDDEGALIERLRRTVRRSFRARRGKSPSTNVHLMRIGD